jgi:hypothetical protein
MDLDTEYCVKVACIDNGQAGDPCVECGCIELSVSQTVSSCNQPLLEDCLVSVDWNVTGIESGVSVSDVTFSYETLETQGNASVSASSGSFEFFSDTLNGATLPVDYSFIISLSNGCSYEAVFTINHDTNPQNTNQGTETKSFNLCAEGCAQASPNPDCANTAWIEYTCDEETGDITLDKNGIFGSTVDTDTFECSTDGIIYGPCAASYPDTQSYLFKEQFRLQIAVQI